MLYLDENVAKDNLTVNQYAKLCLSIDYRNNNIKDHYKSMVANSKLDAIYYFRRMLHADSGLNELQKMIRFAVTYIFVEDNGEFYPSNKMTIYLNNFAKFPVHYNEFSYEGWEDCCEE
jgi:hypothetical protein